MDQCTIDEPCLAETLIGFRYIYHGSYDPDWQCPFPLYAPDLPYSAKYEPKFDPYAHVGEPVYYAPPPAVTPSVPVASLNPPPQPWQPGWPPFTPWVPWNPWTPPGTCCIIIDPPVPPIPPIAPVPVAGSGILLSTIVVALMTATIVRNKIYGQAN